MSKNIQEYVARSVIEHIKYRDEKIKRLEKALDNFNLIICPNCNEYRDKELIDMCDNCQIVKCVTCGLIVIYEGTRVVKMCKRCY